MLGASDAVVTWWGIERHRLALAALAAALCADALVRRRWPEVEWPLVALCAVLMVVDRSGRTWAERVALEARYASRRRLTWAALRVEDESLIIDVGASSRAWCYDFVHRGRLDLADRDMALATRLAQFCDSLADAGQATHVAIHVGVRGSGPVRTTLSATRPAPPPPEWRRDARAGVVTSLHLGRTPILERRGYVRTPDRVLRTLRVASFAPGREAIALGRLSEQLSWLTLSMHASVVAAARARRVTARAVHRLGSDAQVARVAGFRWSARREWELEIVRQREQSVAGGSALCRWALYLVVEGTSLAQLRSRVVQLEQLAQAAGLRLDAGAARQAEWYAFQLPGGPGW